MVWAQATDHVVYCPVEDYKWDMGYDKKGGEHTILVEWKSDPTKMKVYITPQAYPAWMSTGNWKRVKGCKRVIL